MKGIARSVLGAAAAALVLVPSALAAPSEAACRRAGAVGTCAVSAQPGERLLLRAPSAHLDGVGMTFPRPYVGAILVEERSALPSGVPALPLPANGLLVTYFTVGTADGTRSDAAAGFDLLALGSLTAVTLYQSTPGGWSALHTARTGGDESVATYHADAPLADGVYALIGAPDIPAAYPNTGEGPGATDGVPRSAAGALVGALLAGVAGAALIRRRTSRPVR